MRTQYALRRSKLNHCSTNPISAVKKNRPAVTHAGRFEFRSRLSRSFLQLITTVTTFEIFVSELFSLSFPTALTLSLC